VLTDDVKLNKSASAGAFPPGKVLKPSASEKEGELRLPAIVQPPERPSTADDTTSFPRPPGERHKASMGTGFSRPGRFKA
jgi:hypothetical protein